MIALLNDLIKTSFEDLNVLFDTKVVALDHGKTHDAHLKELNADFN